MGFEKMERGPKKDWVRHNEQIRLSPIVVIHEGKNLGSMPTYEALQMARSLDLDLVEIAPNARPPVCHIRDYGKFMFERSKKKKESEKSNGPKEKEVEFRYVIGDHDLETKVNQIKKFLAKGHKVKCVCIFKQREKAHKDQGFVILNRVIELLGKSVNVEMMPKFEGQNIICRFDSIKELKEDTAPNKS